MLLLGLILTFYGDGFQAQVPGWVPVDKEFAAVALGVMEIALGAALTNVWRQRDAGKNRCCFFVAVFPG